MAWLSQRPSAATLTPSPSTDRSKSARQWAESQLRAYERNWHLVGGLLARLPTRLFRQVKLLEYDLAIRYSDSGQFRDVFRGSNQVPLLSITAWLFDDLKLGQDERRTVAESHLFCAALLLACRTHVADSLDSTGSFYSTDHVGLVQYFSEHATEEFARVSADAGFWAKWAYSQTDELEQRLEVREQQRTSGWPADPDKYLHSKWLAAARLTTIAATSFAGRDDVAGPLTEVLEDLTDALQIRDELSTLVSDLQLGRPTYPIAFVAKAAGIPLAPWPDTNEVLGAMIATGSVEAMREAAVGRIGHASARAVEADLHTFVEYLEDAIESLQDRLARPMGGVLLPAPSGRRAHPATATGRSEAVVGDALAMAAGFLLSDRTFKESWESHREGMFGADLVASRFPAGMIMEILSVHGHDVAAEIDGFQAFAVANRFRYFDHPHSGIDTDTLGLYLRLCAYAKKRDAAIDAARPLLACLERNIRQRGSVPVWLGGCDDGVDTRPPVLDLGEGCATVAAHLLIGLSTVQPTDNFDVLELGAGALLQRISTEGMSANVNYPPLYALGTFFRLIRSLVGLPASGELQTRAEVAQATLLTELERATRARVLSALDAALLIAACDLADRRELVRPAWRSIVLQHQRFDGSWRGEPFFAAPNRGRYVTWYESTLLTSALCYDALVRSSG